MYLESFPISSLEEFFQWKIGTYSKLFTAQTPNLNSEMTEYMDTLSHWKCISLTCEVHSWKAIIEVPAFQGWNFPNSPFSGLNFPLCFDTAYVGCTVWLRSSTWIQWYCCPYIRCHSNSNSQMHNSDTGNSVIMHFRPTRHSGSFSNPDKTFLSYLKT